jgi:hypothetical protein
MAQLESRRRIGKSGKRPKGYGNHLYIYNL